MKKNLLKIFGAGACLALASTAVAQNHDFVGNYIMSGFFIGDDGSLDEAEYPLEIGAQNVVTTFAEFDLTNLFGLDIVGNVNGNTFTFTSPLGLLVVAENGSHYTVLSGFDYSEEYSALPLTLTYEPDYDSYYLDDWAIWDYDPQGNTYTRIGYFMSFGISKDDGQGSGPIDFEGTFTVTGYKTVYVNGVAGEPVESEFLMKIQDDGGGGYEFPEFAGYQVGLTSKGWLGVYGMVYGDKTIEIQGNAINSDADKGLLVNNPSDNYDYGYIVALTFTNSDEGYISNFGVWNAVNGTPVELAETWTNLFFTRGDTTAVKTVGNAEDGINNEAPEYYTIQGVKVANPTNGIYIMKQGNTTRKVMIRK